MNDLSPTKMLRTGKLPIFPLLAQKLMKLYEAGADFETFADLINTDVGLTTQLIQHANSAYYKTGNKTINTILPAIRKMGQERIVEIVTTAQLCNTFPSITLIDMCEFWRQSLFTAILARNLSLAIDHSHTSKKSIFSFLKKAVNKLKNECVTPLEMYNLGLFSNIGFIMSLLLTPEKTTAVIKAGTVNNTEDNVYNLSHACLFFWGFDDKYSTPMLFINNPLTAPVQWRASTLMLNAALTLRAHYIPGALVPLTNSYFSTIIEKLKLDITVCDDIATKTLSEIESLSAFIKM